MLQNLTGWHALVILAIVLLIFGSSKLPALAKSVGQSVRILKDEVHDRDQVRDDAATGATMTTTMTAPAQPVVQPVADQRVS